MSNNSAALQSRTRSKLDLRYSLFIPQFLSYQKLHKRTLNATRISRSSEANASELGRTTTKQSKTTLQRKVGR